MPLGPATFPCPLCQTPLRIADLARDAEIVDEARRDAQELVSVDPELTTPRLAALRRMVLFRYGEALDLGDVG